VSTRDETAVTDGAFRPSSGLGDEASASSLAASGIDLMMRDPLPASSPHADATAAALRRSRRL
jgi:hypothetical protein